ncbi:hypothetical protein PFTANZ_04013 [Plasmodium falciparum Tanzania (2000708)]|uniref:Uncharacterized protein n=1 Tax=Plasmodium falciparum Tanzania (2000708) TaxID=1036725 RepID=A0A024W404_PLAFA|nr:hypothetical protein PFTANZ_04013 [Plasmodium falciparum Tanzania (2000708)]
MNLFLQIYSSDAIIEKGKDTYLENLFLYDTNKESNKEDNIIKDGDSTKEKNDFISKNKSCHHTIHNEEDEKLLIGTIFFNFMKYKGLFNKYETDIKNMNIQKKQVFNNEIININNVIKKKKKKIHMIEGYNKSQGYEYAHDNISNNLEENKNSLNILKKNFIESTNTSTCTYDNLNKMKITRRMEKKKKKKILIKKKKKKKKY